MNRKIDDDNSGIIEMKRMVVFSLWSPIFLLKKYLVIFIFSYIFNCVEMLLRYRRCTIFHGCGFVKRLFIVTADVNGGSAGGNGFGTNARTVPEERGV